MKLWAIVVLFAALVVSPWSAPQAAGFPRLFDTAAYKSDSLEVLPQWRRVLQEIAEERASYRQCGQAAAPCSPRALLAWQAMIRSQAGRPAMAQLRAVNRFVNQWSPKPDTDNHQQQDFWSSPLTFLRRSGDCEDYAIIKYVSLREMGFDADRLRIVVVRDTLRDLTHAILAVRHEGDIFILDNLYQAVLPQAKVRQYLPYYSINENARWAHLPANSLMLTSTGWSVTPSAITANALFQAEPDALSSRHKVPGLRVEER